MDIPTREQLIDNINAYLKRERISATQFGRKLFNDTAFMTRLTDENKPSDPRLSTLHKIYKVINDSSD